MQNYWWCAILFRIVLPLVIAAAAFLRPTVTSYIYLIMGCYMPFFSVPTPRTMARSTGNYMKTLMIVCLLNSSLVVSFYFALFSPIEREYDLHPCSVLEQTIRTVGVVEFQQLNAEDAIPWCLPEPLMLVTSVILYLAFKKLCQDTAVTRATAEMEGEELAKEINKKKMLSMMLNFGKYVVVFVFCITAVLRASVFGAIYYFVFLMVMTYWACNKSLGKTYARILICLIPITFANITIIYWYQFQYFQDSPKFDRESLWGRLFNLVDITTYKDCVDPRIFKFHAETNSIYAMPICVFFLYYLSVLVSKEILQAKDGFSNLLVAFFKREKKSEKWRRAFSKLQKQIDDEKLAATGNTFADRTKARLEQIFQFIISIAYLVANFIMMIWAISYVGWKTLILLIWANLIWLMPFRKKVMLATSPLIVAWVWFLLVTSYLYSMDLTPEELPPKWQFINFQSGVDPKSNIQWIHLLTRSLYGVIIFVTMRQLWQERAMRRHQKELEELGVPMEQKDERPTFFEKLQTASLKFLSIWWIWVVIITMISMDFFVTNNIFRIAFVGLAMLFILTFQLCPFKYWKKFLWVYWWIVIIYAMVNLFVVYMYQIGVTRKFMLKHIKEENFKRLGFEVLTDNRELFITLALPLFFQIAVVVQQNYFQEGFDKLTSPTAPEELEREEKELAKKDRHNSQGLRISNDQPSNEDGRRRDTASPVTAPEDSGSKDSPTEFVNPRKSTNPDATKKGTKWQKVQTTLKNVFFELLEVQIQNIALLVGWYMCVSDMCALFVPCVLLFTASCVFGRFFTSIVLYLISFFVQGLIIFRLLYMNLYQYHQKWNYVGEYQRNGKTFHKTLNTADWLGLHQSSLGMDRADFWQLAWCFLYVFVVTVMRIVSIRMRNYRISRNLPPSRVLYPDITFENCHESIYTMFKFLSNYGFYKFGCEITMVFATILMSIRMDAVALLMSLWLLIMFALSRSWMRILWLPTLVITAVAVPAQYLASLGHWPSYWEKSLTTFWNKNDFLVRLQQFCHLENMAHPPKKEKILFDFWFLLMLSRQWLNFWREWRMRALYNPAGSNDNVAHLIDEKDVVNPVPDFVTYSRGYLDVKKRIFFTALFYLALTFTFLAGTMRPTLYSFGYLLGAFIYVWEGTDLFLRPPKSIIRRWNILIGYTILVMITRTSTQIFGCILKYESHIRYNCAVYQMFTIGCVDKFLMTEGIPNISEEVTCEVGYDALGLGYDCLCFAFLIFQQRVFKSYHFFHIVNDAKAQTIMADRGAALIETNRSKRRQALDAEDTFILDNIKKKMDRIRATHMKVQGEVYTRRKKNHRHMLKSSDYYLFDDAGLANDIPLLPVKTEEDEDEFDPYDPMTLTQPEDVKKALTVKDSKPGTSKDVDKPPELSKFRRLINLIIVIWGAFESFIVSFTGFINRRTKNFRSILDEMNRQRRLLKEKTKYSEGARLGSNKIWNPIQSFKDVLSAPKGKDSDTRTLEYSIYIKLLRAIWYLLLSQSEWLCYGLIVLNQTLRANFISLPLVVLTFCWGSLTVPKPTKTFWIFTIAYVLIMLFIKNFFVMDIVPWMAHKKDHLSNLFFPPRIMGLTGLVPVSFNLLILSAFFFHRIVLQMLGLWKPVTYRTASLIEDGEYTLKAGKLIKNKDDKATQALIVASSTISMGDYFPKSIIHGLVKYAEGFRLFIQQLVFPSSTQIPVDVYTPMFFCDLINMFLIVFFFGTFQSDEIEGIIQYIGDNTVPMSFIVAVLIVFFLMVIDRAIYIRKNRFGKLIYHFFQVITFHMLFFVLYPFVTGRLFHKTPVVQVFYIIKCVYFLLSAYQIRNGYPPLVSCHCLWHGTSFFNRYGYKFYRLIPYFFEMRTLLDWICSDSCLGVNDWFKMEEITQNIFDQVCEQEFEEKWNEPAGKAKKRTKKYIFGGFLYALLILTVIFPFLIFSLGSAVGVKTHPAKIKIELYMGSAEPIFQSYASERRLITLDQKSYNELTGAFNNIAEAETLFGNFEPDDTVVVWWSPHSLTKWKVSPGTFKELIKELESDEPFKFRLEIQYTHNGNGGEKHQMSYSQTTSLPKNWKTKLTSILQGGSSLNNTEITLPLVFPKFMKITNEGNAEPLAVMEEPSKNEEDEKEKVLVDEEGVVNDPRMLRNLLVTPQFTNEGDMWWHVTEECKVSDDNFFYYLKNLPENDCEYLVMYTFNEKVFSQTMNYITQSGILGLYLLYFMMVIGIIRGCRIEIGEIWVEDLPNSNDMMRKCLEVYVARDMQNYELEEELFAELIFIMRSREILIKLTRYEDSPYNPTLLTSGGKRMFNLY